jgi:hypothetical protein
VNVAIYWTSTIVLIGLFAKAANGWVEMLQAGTIGLITVIFAVADRIGLVPIVDNTMVYYPTGNTMRVEPSTVVVETPL